MTEFDKFLALMLPEKRKLYLDRCERTKDGKVIVLALNQWYYDEKTGGLEPAKNSYGESMEKFV